MQNITRHLIHLMLTKQIINNISIDIPFIDEMTHLSNDELRVKVINVGGISDENCSVSTETVKFLYTKKLYLPGFFERKAFLIIFAALPLVDFITDYINAGEVLFVQF